MNGITVLEIDGVQVVSVTEFAMLAKKSEMTVRRYLSLGNKYRKMKKIRAGRATFIPISELSEFPFLQSGGARLIAKYVLDKTTMKTKIAVSEHFCKSSTILRCTHECKNCTFNQPLVNGRIEGEEEVVVVRERKPLKPREAIVERDVDFIDYADEEENEEDYV